MSQLDHSHLLYIDAPVGAGYSYVQSDDLYVRTDTEAALDLVTLISQFLTLAPELATAPIYILGESYSGKVAPQFALELHKVVPVARTYNVQ
jgi:serine carboxypeptidase 1